MATPPSAPTPSNPAPRAAPNLFMPNKKRGTRPVPSSSSSSAAAGPSAHQPAIRALGKQRAPAASRSASPAAPAAPSSSASDVNYRDLSGRAFDEYEIVSLGIPPAMELTNGTNMGADFNVIRLYQLNSANPLPDLASRDAEIYFNRQNPNDRPFAAPLLDAEREAKRLAREALKKPIQNGPNGEWRVPVVDRELVHQVDQRTGEKMWRVVQDPSLVAPEARKAEKKDGPGGGGRFDRNKRRGGGGGGGGGRGRGDDRGAKVFARSGNFKDGEASARNHQELNREKLPLVIQGAFPNPEYRPNEPDRTDSRGQPIPRTVEQKWVGKHQQTESEAWAALMFENGAGGQRVTLKVIDREYKFEPHRHINVPTTSYDAGQLVSQPDAHLETTWLTTAGRCCNIWKARTPCLDSHSTTRNPNHRSPIHHSSTPPSRPLPRPIQTRKTTNPSSVTPETVATPTHFPGCSRLRLVDGRSIGRAEVH